MNGVYNYSCHYNCCLLLHVSTSATICQNNLHQATFFTFLAAATLNWTCNKILSNERIMQKAQLSDINHTAVCILSSQVLLDTVELNIHMPLLQSFASNLG